MKVLRPIMVMALMVLGVTAEAAPLLLFAPNPSGARSILPPAYAQPPARPRLAPAPAERPEMRSYQPRSGLQFGFRPTQPAQRTVRDARRRVVMPKPVAPLIEYGNAPGLSLGYTYCPEPLGEVGQPAPGRQCP